MRTNISIVVAAYVRLSVDEAGKSVSGSIENQISLIKEYCAKRELIVAAVFQMRVLAHHAEHALFRMLPHGAGVDNDHVRLGIILGSLIAHVAQHTGNALGIRLILLTAEGLAEKPLLLRQQRIAAAHLFDILQLMRNLLFWNLS